MRKVLLLLGLALGALAVETNVAEAAPLRAAGIGRVGRVGRIRSLGLRAGPVRYGPYLTLRRANAVALYFQDQGYSVRVVARGSIAFGTRTYAVLVW
jgi:hypothetical protein